MQTIQTTTDTATTQPTLDNVVAAYRAKREHEAMLAGLDAAAHNGKRFENFQQMLTSALPSELFTALDLTFCWIGDPFSRYDSHPQATFIFHGHEWTIINYGDWNLKGPECYRERIYSRDLADTILRALIGYEEIAPYLHTQPAQQQPAQPRYNDDMTGDDVPF